MKILMTGATGFIGSHLVKCLSAHEVTCIVSSASIGWKDMPRNVAVEFADITDFTKMNNIVANTRPDTIIHLAAATPVRLSFEMPNIYQDVNYLATVALVHAALKSGVNKFLFASTMETYGWQPQKKPFTENLALNPASPYAVSKVAAENYIKMAGQAYGLCYYIAKPCNTFGRKNDKGFLVEYAVTEMLSNRQPFIGTPNAVRDLMYVDDHVNAYLKLIEFEETSQERTENLERDPTYYVFNFGNGSERKVGDIVDTIARIIGFTGGFASSFPTGYPARPVVEDYLSVNSDKAWTVLEWKPTVTIDDGLKKAIEYWRTRS